MAQVIMVLGGSSSGKSRYAEQITASLETELGYPVYYLATARVVDEELAGRVERHRHRRPLAWNTIEEQLNLAEVLRRIGTQPLICLVDGIGTWISNILIESLNPARQGEAAKEAECLERVYEFVQSWPGIDGAVVLVADEVGWDLPPGNELGRIFMEWNGQANQILAGAAQDMVLVVSGIPVCLKGGTVA